MANTGKRMAYSAQYQEFSRQMGKLDSLYKMALAEADSDRAIAYVRSMRGHVAVMLKQLLRQFHFHFTKGFTMSKGIYYGMGQTNIDKSNGIRYGVIPMHDVCQAWADSSEGDYGEPDIGDCNCPECGHNDNEQREWGDSLSCEECGNSWEVELPDCAEPLAHISTDSEYEARQSGDDCDIFITSSPYYTYAPYCSPCAPGACYLPSAEEGGEKAYCFGHDYFDGGIAPYKVYRVADNTEVVATRETISCPNCKGTGQDSLERIAKIRQCSVDQLRLDIPLVQRLTGYDASSGRFQCWQCNGKGTREEVVIR